MQDKSEIDKMKQDLQAYKSKIGMFKLIYDSVEISYNTTICKNNAENRLDLYDTENNKVISIGANEEYDVYYSNDKFNNKIIKLFKNKIINNSNPDVIFYNQVSCKVLNIDIDKIPSSISLYSAVVLYNSDIVVLKNPYISDDYCIFRVIDNRLSYVNTLTLNYLDYRNAWTDIRVDSNVYEEGLGYVDIINYTKYHKVRINTGYQTVLKHGSNEVIINLRYKDERFDNGVYLHYTNTRTSMKFKIFNNNVNMSGDKFVDDISHKLKNGMIVVIRNRKLGLVHTNGQLIVDADYENISQLSNEYIILIKSCTDAELKFSILGKDGIYHYDINNIVMTIPKINLVIIMIDNKFYYLNMQFMTMHNTFIEYVVSYYKIYENKVYKGNYLIKLNNKDNIILNSSLIEINSYYYEEMHRCGWDLVKG